MHEKFLKYVNDLHIDPPLLEAILRGFKAIFCESINGWSANNAPYFPFVNPVGEPMGSYKRIMKQEPSSIGAAGGAGDTTRGSSNKQSNYGAALPGAQRDIAEETMEQWEEPPKFRKFVKQTAKPIKKIIDKAENHIPAGEEAMKTPINYYSNFHMGNFNVDTRQAPF